jgi:hypothetical protein
VDRERKNGSPAVDRGRKTTALSGGKEGESDVTPSSPKKRRARKMKKKMAALSREREREERFFGHQASRSKELKHT